MAKETKKLSKREQTVLDYIPLGIENKIKVRQIAELAGMDDRTIYIIIESLVHRHKIPVVASRNEHDNGIYIPMSDRERIEGLQALKSQAKTISKRIDTVEKADLNTVYKYKEVVGI